MSSILVSQEAGVLTITLNRPEKLNAFNLEMHSLLRQAIERAAGEADIRAVLLTGSGRGFCAGQDLAERDVSPGAAPRSSEPHRADVGLAGGALGRLTK